MSDTIKIPRPKFERKQKGPNGRVEHDSRGNAVWVRSRANDEEAVPLNPALALEEAQPKARR